MQHAAVWALLFYAPCYAAGKVWNAGKREGARKARTLQPTSAFSGKKHHPLMRRTLLLSASLLAATACAQTVDVLEDFEGRTLGSTITRHAVSGSLCTAKVEADPLDASNKVVHVTTTASSANSVISLKNMALPEGADLTDYKYLTFDYYRDENDAGDARAYLYVQGKKVWQDSWTTGLGATGRWNRRSIPLESLGATSASKIRLLHLGFLGANKDYYIDNIRLARDLDLGYDLDDPATTLRHWAGGLDFNIGMAVSDGDNWFYSSGAAEDDSRVWSRTLAGHFNAAVAGNEMKADATEPQQGVFSYKNADRLVKFCERHDMKLRGHTLVWHSQMPSWMGGGEDGMDNNNGYTREQLLKIMENHITGVVSHFRGKVYEWDVVNEALNPWNGTSDRMRRSIWYNVIGPEYIDSAFVYAHRADPDARLVINDYGVEFDGETKAMDLYNLAVRLKKDGIPITGVGFQAHTSLGELSSKKSKLRTLIRRYQQKGLDVSITELDVAVPYAQFDTEQAFRTQAADYEAVLDVALVSPNVHTLVIWGMSDAFSWIDRNSKYTKGQPVIFDQYLQGKPAFASMLAKLKSRHRAVGIDTPQSGAETADTELVDVYTLHGVRVASHVPRAEATAGLPRGVYVVGGKKVLVR